MPRAHEVNCLDIQRAEVDAEARVSYGCRPSLRLASPDLLQACGAGHNLEQAKVLCM
jgi:hypothetical protein